MTRRRWLPPLLLLAAAGAAFGLAWRGYAGRSPAAPALDAADPRWRWADRLAARSPGPLPDERNAHMALSAAAALLVRAPDTPWTKVLLAEPWLVQLDAANAQPLDPPVVAWWRDSAAVIAAGRRVRDFPRGDTKVPAAADPFLVTLPHLQQAREVTDHLHLDAVVAGRHGDPGGAADSVRAILHIGRVIADEPFSLSFVVGSGLTVRAADGLARLLAGTELPADVLAALQADFNAPGPDLPDALRDLRAIVDAGCDAVADGTGKLANVAADDTRSRADEVSYTTVRLRADQVEVRDRLTGFIALADRPAHEWQAGLDAVPPPPADWRHLIQVPYDRNARRLFATALRERAMVRSVLAAVACERFRLRHGRWPGTLDELPADLRPADTADPHTGRPLILRKLPDGLAVYSVGPDGADHGGDLRPFPGNPPHQDVGVRLWDPAVRGKPPEARP